MCSVIYPPKIGFYSDGYQDFKESKILSGTKTYASNTPPSTQSNQWIIVYVPGHCETRSDLSKGSQWGKKNHTNGPYYNSAFIYLTMVFLRLCILFLCKCMCNFLLHQGS